MWWTATRPRTTPAMMASPPYARRLDATAHSTGTVDVITDPAFRIPTTVDRFGSALYAVNARFDTPVAPDVEYEVVRVVP